MEQVLLSVLRGSRVCTELKRRGSSSSLSFNPFEDHCHTPFPSSTTKAYSPYITLKETFTSLLSLSWSTHREVIGIKILGVVIILTN